MLEEIDHFWKQRYASEKDPVLVARYRNDDRLARDVTFVLPYLKMTDLVLDLGSGPAVLANAIAPFCKHITCVEKQILNWKEVIYHSHIAGVTLNISDFFSSKPFDVILIFGVVNHLKPDEAQKVYTLCSQMMHLGSILILKSQFGIGQDVYVDRFSSELGFHYQSHYRTIAHEMELSRNLFDYQVFDIYPPQLNPHSNTRHYHLLCRLK